MLRSLWPIPVSGSGAFSAQWRPKKWACFLLFGGAIMFTSPLAEAVGLTLTITNTSNDTVTLSDLKGFSGPLNTGESQTLLQKGLAADDINIAAGGTKNLTFSIDVASITISWLDDKGREIETDIAVEDLVGSAEPFDFFDSSADGLYAMNYQSNTGPLPPVGSSFTVANGNIAGGVFNQITFYDVSSSGGDISRDAMGNPISPLLNNVTVSAAFQFEVAAAAVPEPVSWMQLITGTLSLLAYARLRCRPQQH